MGSPAFPSIRQQELLQRSAELPLPITLKLENRRLVVTLLPNALMVVEFSRLG